MQILRWPFYLVDTFLHETTIFEGFISACDQKIEKLNR